MKEPEFSRVEVPLGEPHFDAEATVLHAQPVIPLQTVRAKTRTRRNIFLGIALMGALMLGAVGGTLFYKRQAALNEPATSEALAPESPLADADSAVAAGGSTNETVESEPPPQPAAPVIDSKRSEPKQPVIARSEKSEAAPSRTEKVTKKEPQAEPRDTVSEPDWAEMMREARRAARRRKAERREERARRESDGASRIRDIFEGPNP